MKAREANVADKAAIIELWKRCALTRPWNDPSRDFDFAHSGSASAVIILESDHDIVGAALVGHDGHRGSTYYSVWTLSSNVTALAMRSWPRWKIGYVRGACGS